ncbi:MAG: polysaccharide biosynthesis/export family protein [Muribaculaceae bacterium]
MVKRLILCASVALIMASCSSSKESLTYFEDIKETKDGVFDAPSYEIVISPDDELLITVNSSEPDAVIYYNVPLVNPSQRDMLQGSFNPQLQTYIVDSNGEITYPLLGKIKVSGMTVEGLRNYLTGVIQKDVSDALVRVELVNFYVKVLGEVKQPGRYKVSNQKFSVLDALATAGDMTEYGVRENVTVIREENGKLVYHHLNLNSSEIFTSPYFYLRQNDVVYVEPNIAQQDASKYNKNNAYKVSVISTIVSACSVVVSLVIALTVK